MSGKHTSSPTPPVDASQQKKADVESEPNASPQDVQDDLENFVPQNAKKLTSEEVEKIRATPLASIHKTDVILVTALDAFFENRIDDFEKIVNDNLYADPFIPCGGAMIALMRGIMSMESAQKKAAFERVMVSSHYASQIAPQPSNAISRGFSRLGGLFSRSSRKDHPADPRDKWLRPMEFRAKVVYALSQLFLCFVLFIEQSVTSIIKGGFALKRAYVALEGLQKDYEERQTYLKETLGMHTLTEDDLRLDWNTVQSVGMGLGSLKIMLSLMPQSSTPMLSFLGFEGNRRQGERLLMECFESRTLLSPMASLVLMSVHAMLPSNCAVLVESSVPVARHIAAESMARPPMDQSVFHLWQTARVDRLEGKLSDATDKVKRCIEAGAHGQIKSSFPQLTNFALYDFVFGSLLERDWATAAHSLFRLRTETKWSTLFYTYAEACCYEMMGRGLACGAHSVVEDPEGRERHLRKAGELYWNAIHLKRTNNGGNVALIDAFIIQRLCEMLTHHGNIPHPNPQQKVHVTPTTSAPPADQLVGGHFLNVVPLPSFELLILFSACHLLPAEHLDVFLDCLWKQLDLTIANTKESLPRMSAAEQEAFYSITQLFSDLHKAVKGVELSRSKSINTVALSSTAPSSAAMKASSSKSKKATQLPPLFELMYVCNLICTLLANSIREDDRVRAIPLIDAFTAAAPPIKEFSQTLSYVHPSLKYEKMSATYRNGRAALLRRQQEQHAEQQQQRDVRSPQSTTESTQSPAWTSPNTEFPTAEKKHHSKKASKSKDHGADASLDGTIISAHSVRVECEEMMKDFHKQYGSSKFFQRQSLDFKWNLAAILFRYQAEDEAAEAAATSSKASHSSFKSPTAQ